MLKSECSVCGARRKFKNLMYDQALSAYCSSPMICVKNHPNSPSNCRQRGTFVELMTYEDALYTQKQRTEYTYEETANTFGKRMRNVNMHKLITGSISFRVSSEAQADYISYTLAKIGTNKITDAVHFILNQAIEKDAGFLSTFTQKRGSYTATPNVEIGFAPIDPPTKEEIQEREVKPLPTRKLENDEGVFTL